MSDLDWTAIKQQAPQLGLIALDGFAALDRVLGLGKTAEEVVDVLRLILTTVKDAVTTKTTQEIAEAHLSSIGADLAADDAAADAERRAKFAMP